MTPFTLCVIYCSHRMRDATVPPSRKVRRARPNFCGGYVREKPAADLRKDVGRW